MSQRDAVADRLYGLRPSEFTAARNEAAARARADGDRELADAVHRLRRPTLAAWASNLLVREQAAEADRLADLGRALRQAQEDLDGDRLRELTERQRQVVDALARQAEHLTAEAGQRISADARREVEQTLHAALADPEAARQWLAGRLTRPLSAPTGFRPDAADRSPAEPAGRPAPRSGESGAREREDEREDEREEQRARARRAAEEAARELSDRRGARDGVRRESDEARGERERAREQVAERAERLHEAEEAERRSGDRERRARERLRQADRETREAERRAEDTARRAERLGAEPGRPPEE